jgi:hypothetical protein
VTLNSKRVDLKFFYRGSSLQTKLIFNEQEKLKVDNEDEFDDYIVMKAPKRLQKK